MPTKKRTSRSRWVDSDDAPPLGRDWFARAEIRQGRKLVRRGRPKSVAPKKAINIRIDPDVLAFFRAGGPGWQSRINKLLRKAARL